jgi:hypothetical protein
MNLSPISRAVLRAGTCVAGLAIAMPLLASENAAQPQPQPAAAQQSATDEPDNASGNAASSSEIVVSGQRLSGQLIVDQAPLLELDEAAIAAEGVTSITDLIAQISAQTGSARGRGGGGMPVILINGIRIGSFREFANYPPESLARVEVVPEEVAQRFGLDADLIARRGPDADAHAASRSRDLSLDTSRAAAILEAPMQTQAEGIRQAYDDESLIADIIRGR